MLTTWWSHYNHMVITWRPQGDQIVTNLWENAAHMVAAWCSYRWHIMTTCWPHGGHITKHDEYESNTPRVNVSPANNRPIVLIFPTRWFFGEHPNDVVWMSRKVVRKGGRYLGLLLLGQWQLWIATDSIRIPALGHFHHVWQLYGCYLSTEWCAVGSSPITIMWVGVPYLVF